MAAVALPGPRRGRRASRKACRGTRRRCPPCTRRCPNGHAVGSSRPRRCRNSADALRSIPAPGCRPARGGTSFHKRTSRARRRGLRQTARRVRPPWPLGPTTRIRPVRKPKQIVAFRCSCKSPSLERGAGSRRKVALHPPVRRSLLPAPCRSRRGLTIRAVALGTRGLIRAGRLARPDARGRSIGTTFQIGTAGATYTAFSVPRRLNRISWRRARALHVFCRGSGS